MNFYSSPVATRFSLGPSSIEELSAPLQRLLSIFYSNRHPEANVYARNANIGNRDPTRVNFLRSKAAFLKYIVLDGRRIIPSTDKFRASNGIIQTRFGGKTYVGQVLHILKHEQPQVQKSETLLLVRWFKPLGPGILNSALWDD